MNTTEKIVLANKDKYITINVLPEIFESFANMKQLAVDTYKQIIPIIATAQNNNRRIKYILVQDSIEEFHIEEIVIQENCGHKVILSVNKLKSTEDEFQNLIEYFINLESVFYRLELDPPKPKHTTLFEAYIAEKMLEIYKFNVRQIRCITLNEQVNLLSCYSLNNVTDKMIMCRIVGDLIINNDCSEEKLINGIYGTVLVEIQNTTKFCDYPNCCLRIKVYYDDKTRSFYINHDTNVLFLTIGNLFRRIEKGINKRRKLCRKN